MSLLDEIFAAQEYAQRIDWSLQRRQTEDPSEPFSDRASSGISKRLELGNTAKVIFGRVVDTIAYCHWYKVQPDGAGTPIPCCMLSGTSLTPFGVREHNQLQPNSKVWLIWHREASYGVIIGVEPTHQYDARSSLSDYISLSSRCGVQVDNCHQFPFTLAGGGTITDWSNYRPVDGTAGGEQGWFSESGTGLFVDSTMAFLRGDEDTGIWAFYFDQLLRVAGHNLQIRAAGMEWECLDDQGEFNVTQSYAPTTREALGEMSSGQTLTRSYTPEEYELQQQHYAPLEPAFDDQQPFHRLRHYFGYLATGGRRELVIPPAGGGVNRYSEEKIMPSVFDETVLADGLVQTRSAKGIRIMKRMLGPAAKAVRRPEDAAGDNSDNYKAAGQFGDGPDHEVTGDITAGGETSFNRALGAADGQAYGLNYEGLLAFSKHEQDYYLPEESELKAEIGKSNQTEVPFAGLKTNPYLSPPAPSTMEVDSRYGDTSFYPNVSYLELLDDGGVIIGDGFGSEIRMTGGSISISCPGDLIMQPGRRLLTLATDVITRAHNAVDISSTNDGVRVKAGTSVQVLGEEGVLIEDLSAAKDFSGWAGAVGSDVEMSGVVIKSRNANVSVFGESIYARSNVDGDGIFLDAGAGAGRIVTTSDSFERFIGSEAADYFGPTGTIAAANIFSSAGNLLGAGLAVQGSAIISCSVMARGDFLTSTGYFASGVASSTGGLISPLTGSSLTAVVSDITSVESAETAATDAGNQDYDETISTGLYAADQEGNSTVIAAIGFSFRTTAQYMAEDFRLHEVRWQQMARLWSSSVQVWSEEAVSKNATNTYPFPGEAALTESFGKQDLSIFSLTTGVSKDRSDSAYDSPAYEPIVELALDGNYRIISPFVP